MTIFLSLQFISFHFLDFPFFFWFLHPPGRGADVWYQAIGTVQHDLHRLRRGALNAFFSKRSVNNLAPYIQTSIDKLCSRFEQAIETGERINLKHAYAAFTSDVIREYCFSRSPDAVLTPDFNARSHDDLDVFMETSLLVRGPYISTSPLAVGTE